MGASTADGANIIQCDYWSGNNQQWQLLQIGSGSTYTNPIDWVGRRVAGAVQVIRDGRGLPAQAAVCGPASRAHRRRRRSSWTTRRRPTVTAPGGRCGVTSPPGLASNAGAYRVVMTNGLTMNSGRPARFSRSTDGTNFGGPGSAFTLNNARPSSWATRFGFFNYAGQSPGGAVTVRRFDLTTP